MGIKGVVIRIAWAIKSAFAFVFSVCPGSDIYYGMTSGVDYRDVKLFGKKCEQIVSELLCIKED